MKLNGEWSAFLEAKPWAASFSVYMIKTLGERSWFLQSDGSVVEVDVSMKLENIKPFVQLDFQQIQVLVDACAKQGVLPTGRRHEEEMALVSAHLEDMRSLVFNRKQLITPTEE